LLFLDTLENNINNQIVLLLDNPNKDTYYDGFLLAGFFPLYENGLKALKIKCTHSLEDGHEGVMMALLHVDASVIEDILRSIWEHEKIEMFSTSTGMAHALRDLMEYSAIKGIDYHTFAEPLPKVIESVLIYVNDGRDLSFLHYSNYVRERK
jgi:hypothetical protein